MTVCCGAHAPLRAFTQSRRRLGSVSTRAFRSNGNTAHRPTSTSHSSSSSLTTTTSSSSTTSSSEDVQAPIRASPHERINVHPSRRGRRSISTRAFRSSRCSPRSPTSTSLLSSSLLTNTAPSSRHTERIAVHPSRLRIRSVSTGAFRSNNISPRSSTSTSKSSTGALLFSTRSFSDDARASMRAKISQEAAARRVRAIPSSRRSQEVAARQPSQEVASARRVRAIPSSRRSEEVAARQPSQEVAAARRVRLIPPSRRFVCDVCGDSFERKQNLQVHKQRLGPQHTSPKADRRDLSIPPGAFQGSSVFSSPEPVYNQTFSHATTLEHRANIEKSLHVRADRATSEYDGIAAHPSAPDFSFYTINPTSHGSEPMVSHRPSHASPGEECARLVLPLSLLNDPATFRLYFVTLNLSLRGPLYRSAARALLLFAQRESWRWAEEHCVRLNMYDNSIGSFDRHSGEFTVATRFRTDQVDGGARPLRVALAVSQDLDISSVADVVRWKTVYRASKEHRCPVCDKLEESFARLTEHMRAAHEDDAHFYCDVCGREFKRQRNLVAHQKRLHGEPVGSSDAPQLNQ